MSTAPAPGDNALDPAFEQQCRQIISELNLGNGEPVRRMRALSGGVSSDIAVVTFNSLQLCVKCAMAQLRVSAPWFAPLRRNRAEYQWIEFAASVEPGAVPALYGISRELPGFAMQYFDPGQAVNYKARLLAGVADNGQAARIGHIIGAIQRASTQPGFDAAAFDNAQDFHALRLEPYLAYTAGQHPDVAKQLNMLVSRYDTARIALVHGDLSPKNVLITDNGPVLLDAECATFGDPAFDPAFFINHLLIKSLHMPAMQPRLLASAQEFLNAYLAQVSWEDPDALDGRIADTLPALMLARVDGKSPVEYLDNNTRHQLRRMALMLLKKPPTDTTGVFSAINTREDKP